MADDRMGDDGKGPKFIVGRVVAAIPMCNHTECAAVAAGAKSGPASVVSDSYRDGWDRLWSGRRPDVGQA